MHIIVLSLLCLRLLDCSQQFVLSPFQVFVFAKSFCNVFRTILEAVQKIFTCIYRRMPCNQPKNCHQPCFPRDSPGAYKGGSVLALVAQIGPNQSLFSSFGQRNWHRHTRFGHKIFLCLAILSEILPKIAVKVMCPMSLLDRLPFAFDAGIRLFFGNQISTMWSLILS